MPSVSERPSQSTCWLAVLQSSPCGAHSAFCDRRAIKTSAVLLSKEGAKRGVRTNEDAGRVRVGLVDRVHVGRQLRGLHLRVRVEKLLCLRRRRLALRPLLWLLLLLLLLLALLLLLQERIGVDEIGKRLYRKSQELAAAADARLFFPETHDIGSLGLHLTGIAPVRLRPVWTGGVCSAARLTDLLPWRGRPDVALEDAGASHPLVAALDQARVEADQVGRVALVVGAVAVAIVDRASGHGRGRFVERRLAARERIRGLLAQLEQERQARHGRLGLGRDRREEIADALEIHPAKQRERRLRGRDDERGHADGSGRGVVPIETKVQNVSMWCHVEGECKFRAERTRRTTGAESTSGTSSGRTSGWLS